MMEMKPPAHLIDEDVEARAGRKRKSFNTSFPLFYWIVLLLLIIIVLMVVNGLVNVPPH